MSWTYRPELDGLRTIAVYLVVLYHCGMAWAGGGFIGVDLFFVLSGFLVTNVILSGIDRDGRLRVGDFYARRVRRLLPAAVLVIVATCLLFVLTASQPQRLGMVRDAQSALVYLANWQFIASATDYFDTDDALSPFLHFWSLSIEEQFYVAFPLMLLLFNRGGRMRERLLLVALVAAATASLVAQVVLAQASVDRAYYGTDTRLYQLLAGAALAVAFRELARARSRRTTAEHVQTTSSGRLAALVALAGVAALLLLGTGILSMSVSLRGIAATAASLAAIGGLYLGSGSLLATLLARPSAVWLGQISYGTYLWHWPVILVVDQLFEVRPAVLALLAGAVATGLAALSYRLVEKPIRESASLRGLRWRSVGLGLATSLAVAGLVVSPILGADRTPAVASGETGTAKLLADEEVQKELERPVPEGLDYRRILDDKGPGEQWCSADNVADCVMVESDGPHVLLVGDSHARVLAPAFAELAEEHGFQLSVSIVTSCPWQAGLQPLVSGTESKDQAQCREARDGLYTDTLEAMEADVVVVSALARSNRKWMGRLADEQNNPRPLRRLILETTQETADLVRKAGARLVIVKSLMGTQGYDRSGWDPLDCLSRAKTVDECVVVPEPKPVVDSFYDTIATSERSVATIDLNPLICPDAPSCLPVLDGEVVWRNLNHLTTSIVKHVRADLWELFRVAGRLDTGS